MQIVKDGPEDLRQPGVNTASLRPNRHGRKTDIRTRKASSSGAASPSVRPMDTATAAYSCSARLIPTPCLIDVFQSARTPLAPAATIFCGVENRFIAMREAFPSQSRKT